MVIVCYVVLNGQLKVSIRGFRVKKASNAEPGVVRTMSKATTLQPCSISTVPLY